MSRTLTVTTAPSGRPTVYMPYQSPALCALQDRYGYAGYRDDYRDDTTTVAGLAGAIFDPADDRSRLADYIAEAQPLVDAAERHLQAEQDEQAAYDSAEQAAYERHAAAHAQRMARDLGNLGKIKNFTGGKKIIFSVSTTPECDDLSDEYWPGKTGTCISVEDVSPNALRDGARKPQFYILDHSRGVPGNSDRNITRFFGWRGTTDDRSCHARGVRMVEKIVHFRHHARIYISEYDKTFCD
jgi:hypothetical protein